VDGVVAVVGDVLAAAEPVHGRRRQPMAQAREVAALPRPSVLDAGAGCDDRGGICKGENIQVRGHS
jgi:hypothetical protein